MFLQDDVEDELHEASEGDEDDGCEELADIGPDGSRLQRQVLQKL